MEEFDPLKGLIDKTLLLEFSDDENSPTADSNNSTHFPIIAKILSEKPLNNNAIKTTLIKAWGLSPKTQTNVIEQNTVVFLLDNEQDRRRIWHQSPWSFRGNLIVSKPWFPEEALEEVDLNSYQIWVQATGLPVMFVNKKSAEKIGNAIGKFVGTDLTTESHKWRKALRIRIETVISEPLKDHISFSCKGKKIVLELRYERLGDFCHVCGLVGHKINLCPTNLTQPNQTPNPLKFGPWLKAENGLIQNPHITTYKNMILAESITKTRVDDETRQPSPTERGISDQTPLEEIPKISQNSQPSVEPLKGENPSMEIERFESDPTDRAQQPNLCLEHEPTKSPPISRQTPKPSFPLNQTSIGPNHLKPTAEQIPSTIDTGSNNIRTFWPHQEINPPTTNPTLVTRSPSPSHPLVRPTPKEKSVKLNPQPSYTNQMNPNLKLDNFPSHSLIPSVLRKRVPLAPLELNSCPKRLKFSNPSPVKMSYPSPTYSIPFEAMFSHKSPNSHDKNQEHIFEMVEEKTTIQKERKILRMKERARNKFKKMAVVPIVGESLQSQTNVFQHMDVQNQISHDFFEGPKGPQE
ncbi:UNVERIFIED_CONTAM: hypothetical protein Sradi_1923900 [Sesamum radiatum]|uniref:DUF4283 domain-containing protein n=1 Tax=Sesamum radiatum TaxID=300843 RepID=A0AAW2TDM1_SESRA